MSENNNMKFKLKESLYECCINEQIYGKKKARGVLNFELGMDVRPEVSTTTL